MDTISVLQILVTGPIGMLFIAPLFASQRRSAPFVIAFLFAVLFVIKHIYLLEKCDFFEATWRSALFASIPIVVGYLWARYVLPWVREEREFLSAVPNLKKQEHAPALGPAPAPAQDLPRYIANREFTFALPPRPAPRVFVLSEISRRACP